MILRRDNPFAQVVVPEHKELDREQVRMKNVSVAENYAAVSSITEAGLA